MRLTTTGRSPALTALAALTGTLALALAACGGGGGGGSAAGGAAPAPPSAAAFAGPVGQGEGKLSVLAWPGYAEDGSTDPAVDWVTPVRAADRLPGHREDLRHVRRGRAAVHHRRVRRRVRLRGRLAAARLRRPRPAGEHRARAELRRHLPGAQGQAVEQRGRARTTASRTAAAPTCCSTTPPPTPDRADVVEGHVGRGSPAKGKISPYDDAIYIADAAVYLMATQPDLKITNPYALDQHPVRRRDRAARPAEAAGRRVLGGRTSSRARAWRAARSRRPRAGSSPRTSRTARPTRSVGTTKPTEGATGWSDTWMIKKDTPNINCAYLWLNYIVSPQVNAQIAEYFGEAPANQKSCALTKNKNHCAQFHAEDDRLLEQRLLLDDADRELPRRPDGRRSACPYDEWVRTWSELRSSLTAHELRPGGSIPSIRSAAPSRRPRDDAADRRPRAPWSRRCCTASPRLRLAGLLAPALLWLVLLYLVPLGLLLVTAFWTPTASPARITYDVHHRERRRRAHRLRPTCSPSLRTVGVAVAVTLLCALLALPLAVFMAAAGVPRRPACSSRWC